MTATVTASLDVMGGDRGAEVVLPGAAIALSRHPDMKFRLFGEKAVVLPLLDREPALKAAATFEHCDVSVKMDDKPSQALRRGRRVSSMWRSIEAVKDGAAGYAVSAGNTGALMAMAKFCLRSPAGIDRPAIAGIWPTLTGKCVVLDCGASIGADADALFEFAVMGAAMARTLLAKRRPTVGLLNIGVEEVKGLEPIRLAGQMLKDAALADLDYVGFVEADDIGKGRADVVVTEGFAGNIALKAAEGTAKQIAGYIREAMNASLMARIGYLFARGAFRSLRVKLDPNASNGGVFLGLNGIVIKSHGGTDAEGFASAIEIGYTMARSSIVDEINSDLAAYRETQARMTETVAQKTGAM
ncbi:MAG: phosphate acyltransferase PlsX [Bauldia sp.]